MKKLILASQSPRRRELMMMLDLPFSVVSSQIDETIDTNKNLEDEIIRVATEKANDVFEQNQDAIIISADTLVVLGDQILGKPKTSEKAVEMLEKLSGQTHYVYTGVCIKSVDKTINYCHKSKVKFYDLTHKQIQDYVSTKEPLDKAGAYGIQGRGALLIEEIEGDYYSIMGLPIASLYRKLLEHFA